ncbi:hypothetical protein KQI22_04650 [Kineothrix sp. MSJ-39]|uniref:hypothetical protein n=1 Tax=Kineothrix sp. MSJ-39 TaxID=2841533 RepID=UPI001C0F97FF|nr:hypothetical protein [Kineothrix sp. MSJ-39]MBU5429362.1 hypothetical protein [Kineothrix sp. MSJ-39]
MKKTLFALLICGTLTVSLPSLCVTSYAAPAVTGDTAVEAASDVIARAPMTRWYYKTINGQIYKRLYDCTHEKWLTDWIKC